MSNGTAVLEEVTEPPSETSGITSAPHEAPDAPVWFRQQREQGWRDFSALPAPSRKDQAWRFCNVDALDLSPYHSGDIPSDGEHAEMLERSTTLNAKSARLVFGNDRLLERN